MPTKAQLAEAQSRRASAEMARAVSLAATAERQAMKAIEVGARAVLRVGPLASEYIQAMGTWGFTVIVPLVPEEGFENEPQRFYESEITGRGNDIDHFKSLKDEVDPEYREHVDAFVEALLEFRELHDAYQGAFGNTAAGTPMRFGPSGKVTTEW